MGPLMIFEAVLLILVDLIIFYWDESGAQKPAFVHIKSPQPDTLLASQAQLISKRQSFLRSVSNLTIGSLDFEEEMERLLADYELVVDDAIKNNIDPVSQSFSPNWDYIQAVFFSTTILTTIGGPTQQFLNTNFPHQTETICNRVREHSAKNIRWPPLLHPFCNCWHSVHSLRDRGCRAIICHPGESCVWRRAKKFCCIFFIQAVVKCSNRWVACGLVTRTSSCLSCTRAKY